MSNLLAQRVNYSTQQISKARDECFSLLSNYAFPAEGIEPSSLLLLKLWCRFLATIQVPQSYQDCALPIELNLHMYIDSRLSATYLFLIYIPLFRAFVRLVAALSDYLLAKPELHHSRIKNGNFKWIGIYLYPTFPPPSTKRLITVLLFICVQTCLSQVFPM